MKTLDFTGFSEDEISSFDLAFKALVDGDSLWTLNSTSEDIIRLAYSWRKDIDTLIIYNNKIVYYTSEEVKRYFKKQIELDSDKDLQLSNTLNIRNINSENDSVSKLNFGYNGRGIIYTFSKIFISESKFDNLLSEFDKFKIIAENSPGLTKISNVNNFYYFFNKNWMSLFGIDSLEILAESWFEHIFELDRNSIIKNIDSAFKKRTKYALRYRMIDKNGKERRFSDHGEPYFDHNGFFMGYVSAAFDIEDEIRLEELNKKALMELSISESIITSMHKATVPIIGLDQRNNIVFFNQALINIFNYYKLDTSANLASAFIMEGFKDNLDIFGRVSDLITETVIIRSKFPQHFIDSSGKVSEDLVIFKLSLLHFLIKNGSKNIYLILQDSTEFELKSKQLQIRESHFDKVINSIQDLYFKADKSLVIMEVTEVVREMLGFEPSHILGKAITDIVLAIPSKVRKHVLKNVKELKKITIRVLDSSGEIHYLDCKIRLAMDPVLNTLCFVGTATDVTHLINYQNDLEIKNKKISKLLKTKEAFLANMSHEIRTPLNGIVGISELLNNANIDRNNIMEYSIILKRITNQLMNTVNDILDVSKIESGKFSIVNAVFDINLLCSQLKFQFESQILEKNIKFRFQSDLSDNFTVISDELRFGQILSNLLANAIKFTEHGEIALLLSEVLNAKHSYLKIVVKDTGIGIPKAKTSQLFQPFSQIDSSFNKNAQGTGLGLYISKQLAELLGGRIELTSEEGKGSEFSVYLPLVKHQPAIVEKPNVRTVNFNGIGVLLVDDNPTNLKVVGAILQQLGFTLSTASSGFEAIEDLKTNAYDAILMDIQMPSMDGIECLNYIRANRLSSAPILALTAYSLKGDEEKFIGLGFNGYLSKPITIIKLKEEISLHLPKYTSTSSNRGDQLQMNNLYNLLGAQAMKEMVVDFRIEFFDLLDQMNTGESEILSRSLHTIKGSATTIGFSKTGALAEKFEKETIKGPADSFFRICQLLKSTFEDEYTIVYSHLEALQ